MALPLPTQTFYKMPAVAVAAATVTGFYNAFHSSASSATDYRGTALAATHLWTFTKDGATNGVYASPPAGTSMGLSPGLVWAAGAAAGASTMQGPDLFGANVHMVGIAKNRGAYTAWDNANPWTASQWAGYWKWGPTTLNAITTFVQAYIAQEIVVMVAYSSATAVSVCVAGAPVEPLSDMPGTTCESDSRLYGMFAPGPNALATNWMETQGATALFDHDTTNGNAHGMVYIPGAGTTYTCGRDTIMSDTPSLQQTDMQGVYVRRPIVISRSTATLTQNGYALGTLRNMYYLGAAICTQTRRNGATDLFHVIGPNTGANAGSLILNAAA